MTTSTPTDLAGQRAVVTGGGKGIGAAIAQELAQCGAKVTILGRNRDVLKATAERLGADFDVVDVTDEAQVMRGFASYGTLDILVNCAGAASSAPFHKTDRALWDGMLAVNLTAAYLCSRAAIKGMMDRNYGRIVNVVSTAGLEPSKYVTAYVAAKHGAIGLTRALAMELAETGITVNAVCPGFTDTDLFNGAVATVTGKTGRSRDDAVTALLRSNRQARLVTPAEVARMAAWLCRKDTVAVTGESYVISGGKTG